MVQIAGFLMMMGVIEKHQLNGFLKIMEVKMVKSALRRDSKVLIRQVHKNRLHFNLQLLPDEAWEEVPMSINLHG